MSTTTLLAIIASTWGIALALVPTLQIRHMVESRSSSGISIPYLAVLVIGFALWFAYGVALENLALMIPNTIAFVTGATTIAVARHYRAWAQPQGRRYAALRIALRRTLRPLLKGEATGEP